MTGGSGDADRRSAPSRIRRRRRACVAALDAAERALGFEHAGDDHRFFIVPSRQCFTRLRMTLHPRGLAPRIANYEQWRDHVVRRIRRQLERTAAPGLAEFLIEIESYPSPERASPEADGVVGNDFVAP